MNSPAGLPTTQEFSEDYCVESALKMKSIASTLSTTVEFKDLLIYSPSAI